MIKATNVRSLTDFQRNAKQHIDRLKRTGKPEVLTVNGEAEVVVQSAQAYEDLVQDAEFVRALRLIRKSLGEANAGRGRPMKQFLKELASRHGIDLGRE
ncbi:MAG TPA: type II toxin-antitoxin system Phd/YefM family antitoxin [Tepidisphaeraceae bacterium]|jgi:prevent-host-death family protein